MSETYTITEEHVDVPDRSAELSTSQDAQVYRTEPIQDWLDEAVKQLDAIAFLPDGWDGDGASAPSRDVLLGGRSLLECLHQVPGIPKPHVNPTRDGSVQFEWEAASRYFEIEVVAPEAATYFYQDRAAGVEHEGEIFVGEPLNGILLCIGKVAAGG